MRRENENGEVLPGFWEKDSEGTNLTNLSRLSGNRTGTNKARLMRDRIAKEMMIDNLAPWQFHRALRHH
jgi:hypothetical protein